MAKITVVDDSEVIRQEVRVILERGNHQVSEAADGEAGLEVIKQEKPDLIITDLNMPVKDGIDMVRDLREIEEFKQTIVLMLTTESGTDLKLMGKEVGIRAWVVKPIVEDKLLKVIDKLLSK